MIIAIAVAAAFVVSLTSPLLFRPLLKRFGVIDVPNERSSHSRPVVRGVGLAPLAGMIVGYGVVLASGVTVDIEVIVVLIAVPVAAAVLGLIDDTRGLTVRVRAGTQLIIGMGGAAAVIVVTGASGWVLPFLALGIAGYINVANFMDGIDGISGLHGLIVGAAYAVLGAIVGAPWLVTAGLLLAAAFLAFLPWNLLRGGVFLGDIGSYLLGSGVAVAAVAALASGVPVLAVVGPLAIYLGDTGFTLGRRMLRGERWHEAHNGHVYQLLARGAGMSHLRASGIVSLASSLTAVIGILSVGQQLPSTLALGALMLAVVSIYVMGLVRRSEAAGASADFNRRVPGK